MIENILKFAENVASIPQRSPTRIAIPHQSYKIKPEDIWPNYPKMNALKIGTKQYQAYQLGRDALKIIPVLTGLGMRR